MFGSFDDVAVRLKDEYRFEGFSPLPFSSYCPSSFATGEVLPHMLRPIRSIWRVAVPVSANPTLLFSLSLICAHFRP